MDNNYRFLKSDNRNGISYLRAATMTAFNKFNEDKQPVELKCIPMPIIVECMEALEWKQTDPVETNGWQIDWWMHVITPDNTKVLLSGSWYYGNFKIEIDE